MLLTSEAVNLFLLPVDGYAFSFVFACTVGNLFFANFACFQASVDVRKVAGNVIADVLRVLSTKRAIFDSKI